MRDVKKEMVKAFKIYLSYDQRSDVGWKSPMDEETLQNMKYDCERMADIAISLLTSKEKALPIHLVGGSVISEPYLKCEKDYQLKEMEKLGISTKSQLFEQCVNGLIYRLKMMEEK